MADARSDLGSFGRRFNRLVLGWLAGQLLVWARCQPFSERHSLATIAVALSLTVLGVVRLMGNDGILAVFVAGLAVREWRPSGRS
ncbi:hypothetical protein MPL3365_140188 [Mesorhizobium plurifarium]|uniref:Uncharacterized protein n=1 Tax=Mesorhizobium plurifarium TaxID=69974 RepID=A0A090FXU1_MESPL|nr:hypothetical protein MPL3365_140188 [Mesorhizobium plurifarium]